MTDDQQFILACLTLVVPTIASVFAYRKTDQTHQAVNGMQAKAVRKARAQGVSQGARAEKEAAGTMGAAGLRPPRLPVTPVQAAPAQAPLPRADQPR
jgi:hypothetical protein